MQENLGIIEINTINQFFKALKPKDLIVLKENDINVSHNFVTINLIFLIKNKTIRRLLVSLFMDQKELITLPNKKIFNKSSKYSSISVFGTYKAREVCNRSIIFRTYI